MLSHVPILIRSPSLLRVAYSPMCAFPVLHMKEAAPALLPEPPYQRSELSFFSAFNRCLDLPRRAPIERISVVALKQNRIDDFAVESRIGESQGKIVLALLRCPFPSRAALKFSDIDTVCRACCCWL